MTPIDWTARWYALQLLLAGDKDGGERFLSAIRYRVVNQNEFSIKNYDNSEMHTKLLELGIARDGAEYCSLIAAARAEGEKHD